MSVKLTSAAGLTVLLTMCQDPTAIFESFPESGSSLPYEVLRADLKDTNNQTIEIRNGGYGSAMTAHPSIKTQFYAMTDRGPNAKFTGEQGKGKIFPTPDYTPRIGLFQLAMNGQIIQLDTILLKRPDGTPITGLPNSAALGGTGETPYTVDGKAILVDSTKPFDAETNPIKLDDYGLDPEGLVALKDGTFWVSDEYGPHMVHFDAQGNEIGRINAFADDKRTQFNLPAEFANRRANRGMEGLAITPDEKTLVGIMQSTMYNPSKAVKNLDITRIVTINTETGKVQQFLYQQDKAANSNSEIVAISNDEFMIIERDGKFLASDPAAQKKVYRISLSSGTDLESTVETEELVQNAELGLLINGKTLEQAVLEGGWDALAEHNIKPVEKQLVVDMVAEVNYPHDKMEGLWLIDDNRLGILNDDDFATWSTGGKLEQKMLDSNTIDSNVLYIINTK